MSQKVVVINNVSGTHECVKTILAHQNAQLAEAGLPLSMQNSVPVIALKVDKSKTTYGQAYKEVMDQILEICPGIDSGDVKLLSSGDIKEVDLSDQGVFPLLISINKKTGGSNRRKTNKRKKTKRRKKFRRSTKRKKYKTRNNKR